MHKIIFLDRDGVINQRRDDYVKSWDELIFLPRVFESIKLLNDQGYDIFVVSNQAGISKGLYTQEDLSTIDQNMNKEINFNGGNIVKSYYCRHQDSDNCNCRKPKSGLFKRAQKDYDINLKDAWIIGDCERDIIAGKNAGCNRGILISKENKQKTLADYICGDLWEAVNIVVGNC